MRDNYEKITRKNTRKVQDSNKTTMPLPLQNDYKKKHEKREDRGRPGGAWGRSAAPGRPGPAPLFFFLP